MADVKYFLTSDEKFLIDIDKISLVEIDQQYSQILTYLNGKPIKYNPENLKEKEDGYDDLSYIYNNANDIKLSYYNVYINGVTSPVKLKFIDGIMLMNIINSQSVVFRNNNYSDVGEEIEGEIELNNIKYRLEKYVIPNKIVSSTTSIDGLKSSTKISLTK